MKTRLFIYSAFLMILFASLVSATLTFSNIPTLSQTGTSGTITIATDQNETITFAGLSSISDGDGHTITFTIPSSVSLNNTNSPIIINYAVQSGFNFDFGKEYSTTLTATGTISPAISQKLSFAQSSYCTAGNVGDLEVDIDNVKVTGLGDDYEWYPLDKVEVTVNVENNGDDDIKDIIVEWCLYSQDEQKCIMKEKTSKFDLKDGKNKDVIVNFQLDPEDFDNDNEDYTLYVKAYSKDSGESSQCQSDFENIIIYKEDDLVVADSSITVPESALCGSDITVSGDIWNIGTDDQENVHIEIRNSALGINKKVEIGDIDSFESKDFSVILQIPSNVKAQTYSLEIVVFDEDDEIYETEEDGIESKTSFNIKVDGNCQTSTSATSMAITATLASEVKAGQEVVIKAIITNTGISDISNIIVSTGNLDWANVSDIEPAVLAITKGQSKEVLIKLNINADASGEKTFDIIAKTGTNEVKQSVALTIPTKQSPKFPNITGNIINSENWYLWGIGALNVLLILIIIFVAIRVAKS